MSRLTESARGQECSLRFLPGCDASTVVLAHLHPAGQGKVGGKVSDLWSAYACARCHDIADRRDMRTRRELGEELVWRRIFAGHCETLARLIDAGLVTVK